MNRLRELRLKAGLTQLEMAKRLKISESFYCQLENGKRGIKVPMALKIAGILDRTIEEIFLPEDMAKRQESNKETMKTPRGKPTGTEGQTEGRKTL